MNTFASPPWIDYDYAIVRVVPRVHLCTFLNVGVVLHARTARFLDVRWRADRECLAALDARLDAALPERYLRAYKRICRGHPDAGPIGLLPPSERFHWLTAPRSTVLQTSTVHGGRTRDPARTLQRLFEVHVLEALPRPA